jgi:hypothetical protein
MTSIDRASGGAVLGWLGVALALLFSLYSLSFRYRVEARNRAVELAVELDTLESLAAAEGIPLDLAIARVKEAGVRSAVLSEQTVGELVDDGALQLRTDEESGSAVLLGNEAALERFLRGYSIRFGQPATGAARPTALLVEGKSPGLVRSVAVGLKPEYVHLAQDAGLRIVARASNPTGAGERTVRETVAWLAEQGAYAFLPQGEQALGRRNNLKALAEALEEHGVVYASPEFTKIGGDANVLGMIPGSSVRLHSAQVAELDKLTLNEAVERYVRAGRERDVRILLLRPLSLSGEAPLADFGELGAKISAGLSREGGAIGPAKVFEPPDAPRWVFPAIGLSSAMVAVYAASMFLSRLGLLALVGALAGALGGGAFLPELRGQAALMAAFAFPIAAFGLLQAARSRNALVGLVLIVGVSLVGGLAAAGMLNDVAYFVRAKQFAGVKLAHFGPILLVGLFYAWGLLDPRAGLKSPVTWLQAILALAVFMALAFMFLRTGNENPSAVSGLELRLRSLLDTILPVRPRTKELLLGYPALVVGLGLLGRIRAHPGASASLRGWAVLALAVGVIAPTSVVNTLAHLHTPLEVGLLRIAVGLVLGGIIGWAVWAAVRSRLPRLET